MSGRWKPVSKEPTSYLPESVRRTAARWLVEHGHGDMLGPLGLEGVWDEDVHARPRGEGAEQHRKLIGPHTLAQIRLIREGRGGSPEYRANEYYIRQAHQVYNALMPTPEVPWAALAMRARAAARLAGYTPPVPQGEVLAAARELRNAVRTMVLAAMIRAEARRAMAQWN